MFDITQKVLNHARAIVEIGRSAEHARAREIRRETGERERTRRGEDEQCSRSAFIQRPRLSAATAVCPERRHIRTLENSNLKRRRRAGSRSQIRFVAAMTVTRGGIAGVRRLAVRAAARGMGGESIGATGGATPPITPAPAAVPDWPSDRALVLRPVGSVGSVGKGRRAWCLAWCDCGCRCGGRGS